MHQLLVYLLFGAVFIAAAWTLYASVRPKLYRFAELTRPLPKLPALPPKHKKIRVISQGKAK